LHSQWAPYPYIAAFFGSPNNSHSEIEKQKIEIAKMFGIRLETAEACIRVARQICLKPYLTQNTAAGDRNLR
jgi:hypothetical protein